MDVGILVGQVLELLVDILGDCGQQVHGAVLPARTPGSICSSLRGSFLQKRSVALCDVVLHGLHHAAEIVDLRLQRDGPINVLLPIWQAQFSGANAAWGTGRP